MGAYWDQLLSYAPDLLWKLNEAPGALVVADASPNGHGGDVVVAGVEPTFGEPSLIIPEPFDESVAFTSGTTAYVRSTDGAWADTTGEVAFVIAATMRDTSSSFRRICARNNIAQVTYQGSTSKLRFMLNIAGQKIVDANGVFVPSADTAHLIVAQREGDDLVLYLDGVEVGRATFAGLTSTGGDIRFLSVGYDTSGGSRAFGRAQGFAYLKRSLTLAEIEDLYDVFNAPPNQGPDTPTWSVLSPDGDPTGKTFDDSMQVGAATTDPEGDEIEYWWEWSVDGGATWGIFADMPGAWSLPGNNSKTFNVDLYGFGTQYRVRVKARDVPMGSESDWLESGDFTIAHPATQPAKPELDMLQVFDFSVLLSMSYSSPVGLSFYRARFRAVELGGDIEVPEWDSGFMEAELVQWLTFMPFGSALRIQAQVMDFGGNTSEWSNVVEVMTSRVRTAADRAPPRNLGTADHSLYSYMSWGTAIPITDANVNPDGPEIGVELADVLPGVPGYGARFGMNSPNTGGVLVNNEAAIFQNNLENQVDWIHQIVRLHGAASLIRDPAPTAPWSLLIGFAPFYEVTTFDNLHMELVGVPAGFHFEVHTDGSVVLEANNDNRLIRSAVAPAGTVLDRQMNVLSFMYAADPVNIITNTGDPPCPSLAPESTPAEASAGVNGMFDASLGLAMVEQTATSPCGDYFIHSGVGARLVNDFIDVGKGSSRSTSGTTKGWRGYIGPFILWAGTVITAAEHQEMQKLIRGEKTGDLEEYVMTGIIRGGSIVVPDIYLPFDQPRRPSRPRIGVGA